MKIVQVQLLKSMLLLVVVSLVVWFCLPITQYYTKSTCLQKNIMQLITSTYVLRFLYCSCFNTNFNIVSLWHIMHSKD